MPCRVPRGKQASQDSEFLIPARQSRISRKAHWWNILSPNMKAGGLSIMDTAYTVPLITPMGYSVLVVWPFMLWAYVFGIDENCSEQVEFGAFRKVGSPVA